MSVAVKLKQDGGEISSPFSRRKASDSQIIAAYRAAGSVKAAGALLSICGQSVYERLVKLGACNSRNRFSAADDERLRREYNSHANAGTMHLLAKEMGRTPQFLARQAGRLGLTRYTRKRPYLSEQMSIQKKEWHRNNPHPRGMLGKKHTPEAKEKFAALTKSRWKNMSNNERQKYSQRQSDRWHSMTKSQQIAMTEKAQVSWKSGWREVGEKRIFFRSRWEANYGRYLEWLKNIGEIAEWEHEPETFWFEEIRRGTRSYLPDFRVTECNGLIAYHEVKGWMDPKSKTKIKRMAKYHPHIKLIVINGKNYKALAKMVSRLISGWETG